MHRLPQLVIWHLFVEARSLCEENNANLNEWKMAQVLDFSGRESLLLQGWGRILDAMQIVKRVKKYGLMFRRNEHVSELDLLPATLGPLYSRYRTIFLLNQLQLECRHQLHSVPAQPVIGFSLCLHCFKIFG